ncbi:MAG TPA: hydantoinase/oxoprolinase family protein [Solirubrobacteraceae bacterium]|nr:hydantoinase/oxoprolinase family protein [Solirubrobacteraceae bacterium]
MRLAADTGGTFTDLVVEDGDSVRSYKASTTPHDPAEGILAAISLAAADAGRELDELLGSVELFIHGTTRAINAILTNATARTALLCTRGHPDMLLLREGGRTEPFDWSYGYPDPYIPRARTFEIAERVGSQGEIVQALEQSQAVDVLHRLAASDVEAVAVCLLWSIANPIHELALGELLEQHLPGVPYTLSHALNPTLREYRRASSTAIDASLKPLMTAYLDNLEAELRDAGFAGELLVISTSGGLMHAREAAKVPITSINSGPAMAPVAGRHFAAAHGGAADAIVADTGGTSYDVSVVRGGRIPMSRETWLGEPLTGHITGFPAIDVKSIGAGGGSIAWIDDGRLLHVGPQSAGADPGPAAYGRGGERPTVTDACLALGYLDPERFLGGAMQLDVNSARAAIERDVALPLGLDVDEAGSAILALATEHMVQAITEITVDAGIDPREAVLIGGGGAAGLNSGAIMRRLDCRALVIPETGAVLSAVGALMADLSAEFSAACFTSSDAFDAARVDVVLDGLRERCRAFAEQVGAEAHSIELIAEARLARQVWQIDVPLRVERFGGDAGAVPALLEDFRRLHEEIFAVLDERSAVEIVALRARVVCPLQSRSQGRLKQAPQAIDGEREVYFSGYGRRPARLRSLDTLAAGERLPGPAIVESPLSTVVIEPGAQAERSSAGGLVVTLEQSADQRKGAADVNAVNS